ncbi:MAG: bifunctional ADP-heptose synthase [Chlamydiales bacterium]
MTDLFQKKTILVIGDLLLDAYTIGEVQRISPEAPVPVMRVSHKKYLPGGAGNVMLNLVSLGMEVKAVGRIGCDEGGDLFLKALAQEPIHTDWIIQDPKFQTPIKNRMIASGQQLLRVDYERASALNEAHHQMLVENLPHLLEDVDGIAISDYSKGFLTPSLLASLIDEANTREIPVITDPKGIDFHKYRGSTLLKPNLLEAKAAARLGEQASLDQIAQHLLNEVDIEALMITRSKEGISLFTPQQGRRDFPTYIHEVKDVTGAGDTVLAVVTAGITNKISLEEISLLANRAAGLAIEQVGCARISQEDLKYSPI